MLFITYTHSIGSCSFNSSVTFSVSGSNDEHIPLSHFIQENTKMHIRSLWKATSNWKSYTIDTHIHRKEHSKLQWKATNILFVLFCFFFHMPRFRRIYFISGKIAPIFLSFFRILYYTYRRSLYKKGVFL